MFKQPKQTQSGRRCQGPATGGRPHSHRLPLLPRQAARHVDEVFAHAGGAGAGLDAAAFVRGAMAAPLLLACFQPPAGRPASWPSAVAGARWRAAWCCA